MMILQYLVVFQESDNIKETLSYDQAGVRFIITRRTGNVADSFYINIIIYGYHISPYEHSSNVGSC